MTLDEFENELASKSDEESLKLFCQNRYLHGTPALFAGKEDDMFKFKKRISDHLNVSQHDIFIVGSSKFGFSPHKRTAFGLDSDIDVAIVSERLVSTVDMKIAKLQYEVRSSQVNMTEVQWSRYFKFLRYRAIGWVRPDMLPRFAELRALHKSWFDFFNSISHGKSEAGNYNISAGAFLSLPHLEAYCIESARKVQQKLLISGTE